MTSFADGSHPQHLALVERAPARARGRGVRRRRGRRRDRRLPRPQAPRRRLQPERGLPRAPAEDREDRRLAALRLQRRAHQVPAVEAPRPPVSLLAVELPGRKAPRVPADRRQGDDLLHGQGRDVLRPRRPQGAHRVEAQDRLAERVISRLLARAPLHREPRAAAGRGPRREQEGQGAVAPPASRAQRVLAARPRPQGDLRLRVGRHLRAQRQQGAHEVDCAHRGRGEGGARLRPRHRVRRQLRRRGVGDRRLEREGEVDRSHPGRRLPARRGRLLDAGGRLGSRVSGRPGRARLQLRGEDR